MKTEPDREALHQLIRVLHEVEARPPEVFDMSHYKARHGCGFNACAYGYALSDPWFIERHHPEWIAHKFNDDVLVPMFDGEYDPLVYRGHPHATFVSGQRDVVFGLTNPQFNRLFMPGSYDMRDEDDHEIEVRPHHVIARVKELLAELATQEEEDNG